MALLGILIGLLILIAIVFFAYYNRFVILENRVDNSLSQIDVQLKRRADLIPNLIETVKGFVKHERAAINAVTSARKALVSARGIEERVKADKALQGALGKIFALAESYPTLKADSNFLELQRELATTEDRIAYARQFYNDSILSYNDLCKLLPGKFFAGIYGRKPKQYLQIAEVERKNVKVRF